MTDIEHVLGEDYPAMFAAADASLGQDAVHAAAARVIEAYRSLVTAPETQPETERCVALRLVREALPEVPRELFDAALRYLDSQPGDFPATELTALDEPSPADLAAAAFISVPSDAVYLVTQVAFDVVDGTW